MWGNQEVAAGLVVQAVLLPLLHVSLAEVVVEVGLGAPVCLGVYSPELFLRRSAVQAVDFLHPLHDHWVVGEVGHSLVDRGVASQFLVFPLVRMERRVWGLVLGQILERYRQKPMAVVGRGWVFRNRIKVFRSFEEVEWVIGMVIRYLLVVPGSSQEQG